MSRARKVLMVCMGNICRSPTAEGVLRHKLRQAGLDELVLVDSAGTSTYHVGEPPDHRSVRHALRRGYDLSQLRARKVCDGDFEEFDLILAMDADNFALLEEQCPPHHQGKIRRLTEYASRHDSPVVPDPYYSGADGFERVLDLIEDACEGLVAQLKHG